MSTHEQNDPSAHPFTESLVKAHQEYLKARETYGTQRRVMRLVRGQFAVAMALEAKQEGTASQGDRMAHSFRETDPDLYRYYLQACKKHLTKAERAVLDISPSRQEHIAATAYLAGQQAMDGLDRPVKSVTGDGKAHGGTATSQRAPDAHTR